MGVAYFFETVYQKLTAARNIVKDHFPTKYLQALLNLWPTKILFDNWLTIFLLAL